MKRGTGFDEEGRNWISERLCTVGAVCSDGVIRRVYVPDGEFEKGHCYTTIDNVTYVGDLMFVNAMTGHPTQGPFEFVSYAELDSLDKEFEDEWESMSFEEQRDWNIKMNKLAEEKSL